MAKTIVSDIDSTLADILTPWLDWYNKLSGDSLRPSDVKSWQLRDCVQPEFADRMDDFLLTRPFRDLQPYPGAVEAIREWHEAGHDIQIVTWSSLDTDNNHFDKAQWFKRTFPFLDTGQLAFINRRYRIPADIFIDDKPKAILAYAEKWPDATIWGLGHPYTRAVADKMDACPAVDDAWPYFMRRLLEIEEAEKVPNRCFAAKEDGSVCTNIDCREHSTLPVPAGAFYPEPVWNLLYRMTEDGTLGSLGIEIARLRDLDKSLVDSTDLSTKDRAKLIQTNAQILGELVMKQEKLLVSRKFMVSHAVLKVLLERVRQVLQRNIKDDRQFERISTELAQIDLSNASAAKALIGE